MLDRVVQIVKNAAEFTRIPEFRILEKGSSANIVTSADIAVQKYLCEKLSEFLPEAGFYCEEENLKDTESDYIWIIDPIDGTMNFSRGISDFCISVGLIFKKNPILGVVYLPNKEELYKAQTGRGAFLNDKPIHVSDRAFSDALLCTAAATYNKELAVLCFDAIQDVYYHINDFRRIGTCAEELCYLASGKCELYFEIRINPWDYAGAYAILKEAGGFLASLNNKELTFDRPVVLIGANTQKNLDKLNSYICRYIPEDF